MKVPHMDSGVLFHTLYVTITNFQHHEKRMLIVIHFNPSSSFFHIGGLQTMAHESRFIQSAKPFSKLRSAG